MFSTIKTCNDRIIESIILLTSYFLRLRFVINEEKFTDSLSAFNIYISLSLDFYHRGVFTMINKRWFELNEQPKFYTYNSENEEICSASFCVM